MIQTARDLWLRLLPLQLVVMALLGGLMVGAMGAMSILLITGAAQRPAPIREPIVAAEQQYPALDPNRIAYVFTPEVQYWGDDIMRWSKEYGVDHNILATVVQIESCGDYTVSSPAGAQGLFQVMPFHFSDAEQSRMTEPNINAARGIAYLKGGLEIADGHIGLAMAGYNGGWGVINRGWAGWARETRNYYTWGSQIYQDALEGKNTEQSASLQSWLAAGGINLCRRANVTLFGTATPGAAVTAIPGAPAISGA